MPKAAPALTAFTGGEIGPLADARIDLDAYARSLSRCVNFLPLKQGAFTRRPGERYVASARNSALPIRFIPFIFSDEDAVLVVLNDAVIRFFAGRAAIETSPGVPYEIVHTFSVEQIAEMDFAQSGDVLYLVHKTMPIHTLSRSSNTSWALTAPAMDDGPFMDENATATTVTASGLTGPVTLTASAPIFDPDHVGSLFMMWAKDLSVANLQPWEPGKTYTAPSDYSYYNGRIYNCVSSSGNSGTVPPTHEDGVRWDGKNGASCAWNFVSSLYGVLRITTYTDSQTVTATVLQTLPMPLSGAATDRWAFGAWSAFNGYPGCCTFYQDRLAVGGSDAEPDTGWLSATGDYLNFAPRDSAGLVVADLGIRFTLSSGAVNQFLSMVADGTGIYCTSTGGEFLIAPSTANEPLSQNNIRAIPQTTCGGAKVQPLKIGAATLFVQKGGRKLREGLYAFNDDRYAAGDMTILNPGILASGVTRLAYAQEPYATVWAVLGNGTAGALTYDRENQVMAWSRHEFGGASASLLEIAAIPSPDGVIDDLWVCVSRVVNGQTVKMIGFLDASWDVGGDAAEAFYVDAGVTQVGAAAVITGLAHLEGETVQVWCDGAFHPDCVVSGGQIALNGTYETRTAGLAAKSRGRTMRIEAGAADGTAQGRTKRYSHVKFRVYNSLAFLAGSDASLERLQDRVVFRTADMDAGGPVTPYSGDTRALSWPSGHETDGYICFETDQAGPLTITGIWPIVQTNDR